MNSCYDKYTKCGFLPDMSVRENDIVEDADGIKHRKTPKVFKCLYDNHPLKWESTCPREVIEVNTYEEQND